MYQWLIFLHVLGVSGFLLAHGAAAAVSFRLRSEREIERVRALLDLSSSVTAVASAFLLVLLVAGIAAGFIGSWWGHGWIWASLGLLVLIGIAMMGLGSRSSNRIRQLVQAVQAVNASTERAQRAPAATAAADEQLTELLTATHPELLTAIGGGGLVLILWLMLLKPF